MRHETSHTQGDTCHPKHTSTQIKAVVKTSRIVVCGRLSSLPTHQRNDFMSEKCFHVKEVISCQEQDSSTLRYFEWKTLNKRIYPSILQSKVVPSHVYRDGYQMVFVMFVNFIKMIESLVHPRRRLNDNEGDDEGRRSKERLEKTRGEV